MPMPMLGPPIRSTNKSNNIQDNQSSGMTADVGDQSTVHASLPQTSQQYDEQYQIHNSNPFALAPGELPGYTGWARPEQTLAGYFDTTHLLYLINLQHRYNQNIIQQSKVAISFLSC